MKAILSIVLSFCLVQSSPQEQSSKPPEQQPVTAPTVVKQPLAFGLEDGTPVKLKLNRTISSADDAGSFRRRNSPGVRQRIYLTNTQLLGIIWPWNWQSFPNSLQSTPFLLAQVNRSDEKLLMYLASAMAGRRREYSTYNELVTTVSGKRKSDFH